MARSRNIKPGFFKNAELVELPCETRLLFIGLWTIADRNGLLEDRHKQIKMELYPADTFDVDAMLTQLHESGFINRYEIDGRRYIHVVNFKKHQNPHKDERASSIPAPCEHHASTVQAPCKDEISTVVARLIPDSLLLIPDSLNLDSDADASVVASKLNDGSSKTKTGIPDCPQKEILALYAKHLPLLPQPRVWEGQRANNLKARWRWLLTTNKPDGAPYATDECSALEYFARLFDYVAKSNFLTGLDGKWSGCDLAWLVKAENFAKVIEGKYENRQEVSA